MADNTFAGPFRVVTGAFTIPSDLSDGGEVINPPANAGTLTRDLVCKVRIDHDRRFANQPNFMASLGQFAIEGAGLSSVQVMPGEISETDFNIIFSCKPGTKVTSITANVIIIGN